jgi:hypothetical protein
VVFCGNSVDAWRSPLWVDGPAVDGGLGQGFFAHAHQKSAGQRCDDRLAGIFGGEGSVFATDRDPSTLANPGARDRNRLLSPSESPVNGHAHIYASPTGAGVAGGNLFTQAATRARNEPRT